MRARPLIVEPPPVPTATPIATPTPFPRIQTLQRSGVSWTFDRPYRFGTFANGDYWVAPDEIGGSVGILAISPDFDGSRNGWEVNPDSRVQQGFDHRISGFLASRVPALPFQARGGDSIVKARSVAAGPICGRRDPTISESNPNWNTEGVCLDSAAVLTILSEPLVESAQYFRPPYVRAPKSLRPISSLRTELLPSLSSPVAAPAIADFSRLLEDVQLDHFSHWGTGIKPLKSYLTYTMDMNYFGVESMNGTYGANISMRNNDIALRLMLNDPLAEKMPLLVRFIQQGIDIAAAVAFLDQNFSPGGGHGQGRLLPILFAGILLNDQEITQLGQRAYEFSRGDQQIHYPWFGEGGVVRSSVTGQALYGEPTCWDNSNTFADYEREYWIRIGDHAVHRTCSDPYELIDGGDTAGGAYQSCCSTGPWTATALAMTLMPELRNAYGHPEFFEYSARWMESGAMAAPDICAPAPGVCNGGPNAGMPCTTANQALVCDTNEYKFWCQPDFTQYGITFGPRPNGSGCIEDQDPSDGIGRFPLRHGLGAGSAWSRSAFSSAMWESYGSAVGG